jgi:hypothetical protein
VFGCVADERSHTLTEDFVTRSLLLGLLLALASCGGEADIPPESATPASPGQAPIIRADTAASIADSLIAFATGDFDEHGPLPDTVRTVRLGSIAVADGASQYMLCGEFLAASPDGAGEWSPFATIKTARYEQLVGGQAASVCSQPSLTWDIELGELTAALQSRLNAIRR